MLHVAVVDFQALFHLALMLHYPVVSWVRTGHIIAQSFITMSPFASYSRVPSGYSLLLSKLLIIWLAYCLFFLKSAIQGYILESCNWFSTRFVIFFQMLTMIISLTICLLFTSPVTFCGATFWLILNLGCFHQLISNFEFSYNIQYFIA